MPKQPDEMTAQEAAAVLERSDRYVRKLAQLGKLAARIEGEGNRSTVYPKRDAVTALREEWDRQPPKRGRPRLDQLQHLPTHQAIATTTQD